MTFLYRKLLYMCLAAFMTFIASCGGGGGGGSTGAVGLPDDLDPTPEVAETGTVTILATDAETDQFREINLTVTRAELLGEDSAELLFEGEKTFNLLALASVTEVFSVAEVPAGTYDKIRLTLAQIELVFFDERESVYPRLPGNGKLDINPTGVFYVDSDNPLTLQLDFDAEKSIHIIGQGNGGFNFRPVVLTTEVETEFDTKLIRQMGVVRELNRETGTFYLCLIEEDADDEEDCVQVAIASDATAIFSEDGSAIGVSELNEGDTATVVGRIYRDSDLRVAAAGGGMAVKRIGVNGVSALEDEPLCDEVDGELVCDGKECEEDDGLLICDDDLVCDDIQGELHCKDIEDEDDECFEYEGHLICDDDCETDGGLLICDDDEVCEDVEGELICKDIEDEDEDDECFEYEGHLICDDDCEEDGGLLVCDDDEICEDVEGELVCKDTDDEDEDCHEVDGELLCGDEADEDERKDDCREVDGELLCDDEEDEEEQDEEEQDEEEDNRSNIVLVADIIWLGDGFERSENIACSGVDVNNELGTFFQNAELDGADDVLCSDEDARPTVLLPGARVYNFDGMRLSPEAIEPGAFNLADGFEDGDVFNAVLVIMEPVEDDDRRGQLSGGIGVLEEEGLTLITDEGDRCVVFDDAETQVFLSGLDGEGNAVFSEGSVADLAEGQRADAFGEANDEGCLEAETFIVEDL